MREPKHDVMTPEIKASFKDDQGWKQWIDTRIFFSSKGDTITLPDIETYDYAVLCVRNGNRPDVADIRGPGGRSTD
jgi:hypothetical protein